MNVTRTQTYDIHMCANSWIRSAAMMRHELTNINVAPTNTYESVTNVYIYTMCANSWSRSATMVRHDLTHMNVTPTRTYDNRVHMNMI